jgi:hypothetical protein
VAPNEEAFGPVPPPFELEAEEESVPRQSPTLDEQLEGLDGELDVDQIDHDTVKKLLARAKTVSKDNLKQTRMAFDATQALSNGGQKLTQRLNNGNGRP